MPTGYTEMIDTHPKMTTKKWILTGLARAFGVCVTLREEPMGLTEAQIRERIAKDGQSDIDWHKAELDKAVSEMKTIGVRTETEWKALWQASEKHKKAHNALSIAEAEKIADRHEGVRKDLLKIVDSDVDEFTRNIAKYGLDQLKLTQSECEPFLYESMTLDEFKGNKTRENVRDIEYHTKEMAQAQKRVNERVQAYMTLRKDLDKVFG